MEVKVIASSSKGNATFIKDKDSPLLLDAGVSKQKLKSGTDYQLSQLVGCLITHEHSDHIKGIDHVLNAGVDMYMTQGTAEELMLNHHRIKYVTPGDIFRLGRWWVLPFKVSHNAVKPVGFLISSNNTKIFFATDSVSLTFRVRNVTHWLVECNYVEDILNENLALGKVSPVQRDALIYYHLSLGNLKKLFQANDLSETREIHLLHTSLANADSERMKKELTELTGACVYGTPDIDGRFGRTAGTGIKNQEKIEEEL